VCELPNHHGIDQLLNRYKMPSELKTDPPVFIIGNPRSGTTMLRLMLTLHREMEVPPESGWLIELYGKYQDTVLDKAKLESFVDDLLAVEKIEEWQLDRSELLNDLKPLCPADFKTIGSAVYMHYARRRGKKRRWGDKNNFFLNHIDKLDNLFPEAKFLHIVRDGRDVACSYRDLVQTKGLYAPDLPSSVCGAAIHWRINLNKIQKSFTKIRPDRVLTVRYEDLVQEPREILEQICSFLGLEFDNRMLLFSEINTRENLEPDVFMSWKALTKQPVTTARVGRWKREMFQEDQLLFEFLAKNTLTAYAYELSNLPSHSFSGLLLRLYAQVQLRSWSIQKLLKKGKNKLLKYASIV
jgi:hypothetical protein